MLFFYIRHGDPIYSPDSLTELGEKQANALAKRLSVYGIDKVYSSPSVRARQTAQPTCDLLKKEMTICEWANESRAWEGFAIKNEEGTLEWCFQDDAMYSTFHLPEVQNLGMNWHKHPAFCKYHFSSAIRKINESLNDFLLELGYKHDCIHKRYEILEENNDKVALFAHQGFGLCFLSSMLDIPYPIFSTHFDFGHSSVTVINFEQHGQYAYPKVLQLSNDSHLYKEDILTGYQNKIFF